MSLKSEEIALQGDHDSTVALILPNGDKIQVRYNAELPCLEIVLPSPMFSCLYVEDFEDGTPDCCSTSNSVIIHIPKEMVDS